MPDERPENYLDREGWQRLAELARDHAHLAGTVGDVAEIAHRNDRTLRGHNGTVGVVADVADLKRAVFGGADNAAKVQIERAKASGEKWAAVKAWGPAVASLLAVILSILSMRGAP